MFRTPLVNPINNYRPCNVTLGHDTYIEAHRRRGKDDFVEIEAVHAGQVRKRIFARFGTPAAEVTIDLMRDLSWTNLPPFSQQ